MKKISEYLSCFVFGLLAFNANLCSHVGMCVCMYACMYVCDALARKHNISS